MLPTPSLVVTPKNINDAVVVPHQPKNVEKRPVQRLTAKAHFPSAFSVRGMTSLIHFARSSSTTNDIGTPVFLLNSRSSPTILASMRIVSCVAIAQLLQRQDTIVKRIV
jgi:hypothetical protein